MEGTAATRVVKGQEAGVSSFGVLQLEWRAEAGATIVAFVGEVDASAIDVVEGVAAVAAHAPLLVLDLAHVSFIDPAGLRLLQQLTAMPNVVVQSGSPALKHLLDALGLVEL